MNVRFFGADLAGILYFVFNIPLLLFTGRALGKSFVGRTLLCATLYSVFCSLIPIPAQPVIEDPLTSCLLGAPHGVAAAGAYLRLFQRRAGCDGPFPFQKERPAHGGQVQHLLQLLCCTASSWFLFNPAVVIYSVIYNYFTALVMDKTHQQNVTVQVLIFTKEEKPELPRYIMEKLGRGVTYWTGCGGYTGQELRVLCVCLSKYEIEDLRHAVHQMDPRAFFIIQEGVAVDGNFVRKIAS